MMLYFICPATWKESKQVHHDTNPELPVTELINNIPPIHSASNLETEHSYSIVTSGHGTLINPPTQLTEKLHNVMTIQPPILSTVPTIGPLHISLNSREIIVGSFHPFFKVIYETIFPRCKFPESPQPWRISLILEVVYGAWTLIRSSVIQKFCKCKDLQYGTLFNLLDNYIPLVLSIYSTSSKLNNFTEYLRAMVRIWVMFTCLKRRHYNKAPLVWINMCAHWGNYCPQLQYTSFYTTKYYNFR